MFQTFHRVGSCRRSLLLIVFSALFTASHALWAGEKWSEDDPHCPDFLTSVGGGLRLERGSLNVLAENLRRSLNIDVRLDRTLPDRAFCAEIESSRITALRYNPGADGYKEMALIFGRIQGQLAKLKDFERLGVRLAVRQFDSRRIWIDVIGFKRWIWDPQRGDPNIRIWANRVNRRDLRVSFDSALTSESADGNYQMGQIRVNPRLLHGPPTVIYATMGHEAQHGAHEDAALYLGDFSRWIRFIALEGDVPGSRGLPGLSGSYARQLVSGELEAQIVGLQMRGLSRARAWARSEKFLGQHKWLKQLLREVGDQPMSLSQHLTYEGHSMAVVIRHVPAAAKGDISNFVRETIQRRVRQLENLARARGEVL